MDQIEYKPIKLGKESQLFIDDYCLGRLRGVKRRFHQAKKHPANPLMTPEGNEKYIQVYGNVIYDPESKLYRMWYNAHFDPSRATGGAICHAASQDGINWQRTHLSDESELPNAVLSGYFRGPTVFYTPDDPDPCRRYRMFIHTGNDIVGQPEKKSTFTAGYSVLFSPDGYDWIPYKDNPIMQGGDIASCMYDPVTKDYIAFPKIHSACVGREKSFVVDENKNEIIYLPPKSFNRWNRRCVGISASKDFITWGTPEIHLSADAIDDARVESRLKRFRDVILYDDPDFYSADMQGMTGFRYEGLRLGLIWFYDRSACRPFEFGGNDDGVINIQLAYSREQDPYGFWHRTEDRFDFIQCGDNDDCDAAMIFTAHTVVQRDDDILFYYTGFSSSHGNWGPVNPDSEPNRPLRKSSAASSSINLATIRKDGFASIDGLYPPGIMTTKLLTFEGEKLQINANAENGRILAELTDQQGKPIAGFTKGECIPFCENKIRGQIQWKSDKNLASLCRTPVYISFYIHSASLYSFKIS